MGEYAHKSDSDVISSFETENCDEMKIYQGEYKLGIETDATGNSAEYETILFNKLDEGENAPTEPYTKMQYIESFDGHMTIYDSSYMVFGVNGGWYFLNRDTKKTKDKTVYFDKVGTDGVAVDRSADEVFGE